MDQQRITRIPSIFDSEDEDDDSSMNNSNKKNSPKVSAHNKSPVPEVSQGSESPRNKRESAGSQSPRNMKESTGYKSPKNKRDSTERSNSPKNVEAKENDHENKKKISDVDKNSECGKDDDGANSSFVSDEQDPNVSEDLNKGDSSSGVCEDDNICERDESTGVDADNSEGKELKEEIETKEKDKVSEPSVKDKGEKHLGGDSEGGDSMNADESYNVNDDSDDVNVSVGSNEMEDNENGVNDENMTDGNAIDKSDFDDEEEEEELNNISGNEEDTCDVQDVNEFADRANNGRDEEMDADGDTSDEMEESIGGDEIEESVGVDGDEAEDSDDNEELMEEEETMKISDEANDSLDVSIGGNEVDDDDEDITSGSSLDEKAHNNKDKRNLESCDVVESRNNDEPSENEDGSDAYVIDLNDSDENAPDASKIEDREDVLASSSSASPEINDGKEKSVETEKDARGNANKDVDKGTESLEGEKSVEEVEEPKSVEDRYKENHTKSTGNKSEEEDEDKSMEDKSKEEDTHTKLLEDKPKEEDEDTKSREGELEKDDEESKTVKKLKEGDADSSKPSGQIANAQNVKTSEANKRSIPLVRVPVRVEDVYTDSEDEAQKQDTPKVETDASSMTAVSDEEQRDVVSLTSSSRPDSTEPEPPSEPSSQVTGTTGKPRIWISSSLFAKEPTTPKVPESVAPVTPVKQSSSSKRRYNANRNQNFDKEKCLYALDAGWKRELVYRAQGDANGRKSDVYYYTPEGKKLRSKVEIEDYLLRKKVDNLTLENFTFFKGPLGADESQESIRHADQTRSVSLTNRRNTEGKGKSSSPKLGKSSSPKLGKSSSPKLGKSSSPKLSHPVRSTSPSSQKSSSSPLSLKRSSLLNLKRKVPEDTSSSEAATKKKTKYDDISILQRTPTSVIRSTQGRNKTPKSSATQVQRPISSFTLHTLKPTKTYSTEPSKANSKNIQVKRPLPIVQDVPGYSQPKKQAVMIGKQTTTIPRAGTKNHVVFTTKLCESEDTGTSARIFTPMLSESERQQPFHCTGVCRLGGGTVPNLQCIQCLCLFHGKCTRMLDSYLSLIMYGKAKFLCPNCYKENKETGKTARRYHPPIPHEPLAQDPTSSEPESEDTDPLNIEPDMDDIPSTYAKVSFDEETAVPTPPQSPENTISDEDHHKSISSSMDMTSTTLTFSSAVTTTVSSSSNSDPLLNSADTTVSGSQQIVGNSAGGQFFKIPSPTGGLPRFVIIRPQQPNVSIQNYAQLGAGLPVFFPGQVPLLFSGPGVPPTSTNPLYVNGGMTSVPSQIVSASNLPCTQSVSSTTFQPSAQPEKLKTPPRSQPKVPVVEKKDFLQELSSSYRLLLNVFKYLTAKDLLITSQVCVMWRDLSYSSSLWQTLRLRNICVRDWELLAGFLERRNTKNIDLRKMVFRIRQPSPEAIAQEFSVSPSHTQAADRRSPSKENIVNHDISKPIREGLKGPSKESKVDNTQDLSSSPGNEKTDTENLKNSFAESRRLTPITERCASPTDSSEEKCSLPNFKRAKDIQEGDDDQLKHTTCADEDKIRDSIEKKGESTKEDKVLHEVDCKLHPEESRESEPSDTDEERMEIDEGESKTSDYEDETRKSEKKLGEKREEKRRESRSEEGTQNIASCSSEQATHRRSSRTTITPSSDKDIASSTRRKEIDTWRHICEALGTVRCLSSVVLPPCTPEVVHLLLSSCKNISCVTAADLTSPSDVQFDPSYFMEAPKLREIRIGSTQGLSFTTNFNFIKLQELKVLVVKGFVGNSWPYLGTNLTSLHLGPCHSFTNQTWINIGNMKNLKALWLEDGGSLNDSQMVEALGHLSQLRRLCLFNYTVGSKLGMAVKKLTKLERFFILQNSSEENMGIKNHNMLAVTEHMKYVNELVWAVSSQDVKMISGIDHMHICSPKLKSYPTLSAAENGSDQWPLKLIETVVKRHLPLTNVRIMKLDPAAAARMALSTL